MAKTALEASPDVSDATAPERPAWREAIVREILFPSDLSRQSDQAFAHARLLAQGLGARLVLYHAVERAPDEDPVTAELRRRIEGAALEHLEYLLEGVEAPWHTHVETAGSASQALLQFIRSHLPDLTVMATHGRDWLSHLLLGSVTESVLRERRSPVLCVREPQHGAALAYRRVLVPTDLSEASCKALPWAALLARSFESEVLAVHCARTPVATSLSGVPELVERAFPSEAEVYGFVAPHLEGLRLAVQLHAGQTWDRLIDVARTEKADVIVTSAHGRLVELLVRHAPCPVLVV